MLLIRLRYEIENVLNWCILAYTTEVYTILQTVITL